MGTGEAPVTILFADVEDSTPLFSALGDNGAQRLIGGWLAVVDQAVVAAGGRVVKRLGDGLLAVFTSPRAAVASAVESQVRLSLVSGDGGSPRPRVRMGLNGGEVVVADGDVHGAAVAAAARICAHAAAGQVLISDVVRLLAGTVPGVTSRDIGLTALKGFSEPVRLHEVTRSAAGPPDSSVGARPKIRVVVAEDALLVREGMVRLLGVEPDLDVVGSCADFDSLMVMVGSLQPDVVLTDICMPPSNTDEGIRAAVALRKERPQVGVVVLSSHNEPRFALDLLEEGAEGRAYLLKDRLGDEGALGAAVREVAAGGSVIDPKVVEALVQRRRSSSRAEVLESLTVREGEVLGEMASGKSNAAVAAALGLSSRAVEKHINSLFAKLGLTEEAEVHRRVKAVLWWLDQGSATSTNRGG